MLKERTIKIIKYLINTSESISLDILAKEFHVSERTIRNEISEANYFLTKKGLSYIKNIRKKGLTLTLNSQIRTNLLKSIEQVNQPLLPEERCFDLILAISLSRTPTYLYQKEKQYQVSKSTLDEDMRKVRQFLHYYQIEVVSVTKKGLVINGAERSIRTMLFDLINNSIGILDYQINHIDESMYEKILFSYIAKSIYQHIDVVYDSSISSEHDNYYRKYFLLFTSIWLGRIKNGKTIAKSLPEILLSDETDIISFIRHIIQYFKIYTSTEEIKYLSFILQTLNPKTMSNSLEWVQAQLLTIQLIKFVENDTGIAFSRREEELYEGLYRHITGLLSRMRNDLQVVNPLKDNIKNSHSKLYCSIAKFAPTIEKTSKKKITHDEIAFLTIYFSTSESKINQDLHHIYKAAVICNHGMATARLLSENLKESFNIDVVATLSSREVEILYRLDVDVIFSTIRLTNVNKPYLFLPPIIRDIDKEKIHTFLNHNIHLRRTINERSDYTQLFLSILNVIESEDITITKQLYHKLEKTLGKYDLKINQEEIQPMLKELLKESDILFDLSVLTWEEAIEEVSVPLIQSQTIEPRYIDSMIESVKKHGPYIVIGKHIALAHARPEDGVRKLGVSVAKLKHPIKFGNEDNDPVKVIFCLAAIDSYSHLNIMKNLVSLINNDDRLNLLFTAKNKQDFQQILYSDIPE